MLSGLIALDSAPVPRFTSGLRVCYRSAMQEEMLEIVDALGRTIGQAPRSLLHGNPSLMHKVVHVLVFNDQGHLLLQKRSLTKDVAPGKWDTSVGGHMSPEEDLFSAVRRETEEELGITPDSPEFLYSYIHSNDYETELVFTHACVHNGPFTYNAEEIDEVRFWDHASLSDAMGTGVFSDNFESELSRYRLHVASRDAADFQ